MIRFQRVKATDVFATRILDFTFSPGIYSIVGLNGSSKTSLFLTLIQGLYNRNPKKIKIDDVSNAITGKPYEIEIWFERLGENYHIINSKKTGKIEIYRGEFDMSLKRIPDNLKLIEELIGSDYETFVDLVYQSPESSLNLLETNSDGARKKFIARILKLDELDAHFERIKGREKEISGKNGRLELLGKQREALTLALTEAPEALIPQDDSELIAAITECETNLEEAREHLREAQAVEKELSAKITVAETQQENKAKRTTLQLQRFELKEPAISREENEAKLLELTSRVATHNAAIARLEEKLQDAKTAEFAKGQAADFAKQLAEIEIPEKESSFYTEQLRLLSGMLATTVEKAAAAQIEVNSLEKGQTAQECPTCGHQVEKEKFAVRIAELKAEISAATERISKGKAAQERYQLAAKTLEKISSLTTSRDKWLAGCKDVGNIDELSAMIQSEEQAIATTQAAATAAMTVRSQWAQIEKLEKELAALPAIVGDEESLNSLLSLHREAGRKIVALLGEIGSYVGDLGDNKEALRKLQLHNAAVTATAELIEKITVNNAQVYARIATAEAEVATVEEERDILKEWLEILGPKGYRVHKIERFLKIFNLTMNRYSDMISEGRIQCRFFIADGEIEFAITDGFKEVAFACWSAGEKARIKLACLFATLELLEIVGAVSYNVLALDEIFGALDDEGKEGLFRVLAHLQRHGKAIYTIAHSELAMAMEYDGVIHAIKHDDGTTSLSQE